MLDQGPSTALYEPAIRLYGPVDQTFVEAPDGLHHGLRIIQRVLRERDARDLTRGELSWTTTAMLLSNTSSPNSFR